jgi:hypothetical protein
MTRLRQLARRSARWLGEALLEHLRLLIHELLEIARRGVVAGLVGLVAVGTAGGAVVAVVASVETIQQPVETRRPWWSNTTDTLTEVGETLRQIGRDIRAIREAADSVTQTDPP